MPEPHPARVQEITIPGGKLRDRAIDVVRGLCIFSMIVSHMASGSILSALVHPQYWTDAAFGFVFLSGLLLGIVYRRGFDRSAQVPHKKLVSRSFKLYWIQLAILILALSVRSVLPRPETLPTPETHGGWGQSLILAATLQLPAPNLTILPMYVVLLLWAVLMFKLLQVKRGGIALTVSGLVYSVSLFFPAWTVMPYLRVDPALQFSWAAWQFPFVLAVFAGWYWQERRLQQLVLSRPVLIFSAISFVSVFIVAQLAGRLGVLGNSPADQMIERLFAKFDLGPGAIFYGLVGLILVYWVASVVLASGKASWVLAQIESVGRHSLSSFILLCLAVILLPAGFSYSENGVGGMLAAITVVVVCVVWSRQRDARKSSQMPRHPAHA